MTRRLVIMAITAAGAVAGTFATRLASAQHPGMPPGMTHEEHLAQTQKEAAMKRRGADAMGFDQDKTTHHFQLTTDGGVITVSANNADDVTSRDRIRAHLKAIAEEFARGEFGKPAATHAEVPRGVEAMQRWKERIRYVFEDTPRGGQVRITTADATAVEAIHRFLRYQITEHHTGDPLAVQHAPAHDR